jgi:diaminopimelate decarboxylase
LIIDETALRDRARRYRDGLRSRWPNSEVIWASKSLPLTSVFAYLVKKALELMLLVVVNSLWL